jgi:hypothetical protein
MKIDQSTGPQLPSRIEQEPVDGISAFSRRPMLIGLVILHDVGIEVDETLCVGSDQALRQAAPKAELNEPSRVHLAMKRLAYRPPTVSTTHATIEPAENRQRVTGGMADVGLCSMSAAGSIAVALHRASRQTD